MNYGAKKDLFKTDKSLYDYSISYDYSHLPKDLIDVIQKLENYDKQGDWFNYDMRFPLLETNKISYGGHSGSKKGVIINDERWFLKYPKSTKSMDVEGLSYSTSPLSEYLASHIYEKLK